MSNMKLVDEKIETLWNMVLNGQLLATKASYIGFLQAHVSMAVCGYTTPEAFIKSANDFIERNKK